MTTAISKVHQYAALVVTVSVLGVLLFALIYPRVAIMERTNTRIDEIDFQIGKYLSRPTRSAATEDVYAALDQRIAAAYFTEDTSELAFAALQAMVRELARKNGAEVISSTTKHKDNSRPFTEIRVGVHLSASTKAMTAILRAVENHPRRLFIDNLSVRQRFGSGSKTDQDPKRLDVRFDVFGFYGTGTIIEPPS